MPSMLKPCFFGASSGVALAQIPDRGLQNAVTLVVGRQDGVEQAVVRRRERLVPCHAVGGELMRAEELPPILPNFAFLVPPVRRDPDDLVTENGRGLDVGFRRIVGVGLASDRPVRLSSLAACRPQCRTRTTRQLVIADDDVPAVERDGSRSVADSFEHNDIRVRRRSPSPCGGPAADQGHECCDTVIHGQLTPSLNAHTGSREDAMRAARGQRTSSGRQPRTLARPSSNSMQPCGPAGCATTATQC